jgi:hypothetical protein
MNSLPTIDRLDYYGQLENNNQKMSDLFKGLFPDIEVPYEYLFELADFLAETKVNARILPKVIRGVHNILIGTGKGQVIVHVQGEVMNVSVRETDEDIRSLSCIDKK